MVFPTWGGHDQSALSHAEGCDQIDRTCGRVGFARLLQKDPAVREHGGQFVELRRGLPFRDGDSLDGGDRGHGEASLGLEAERSGELESGTKFVLAEKADRQGEIRRGRLEIHGRPADHRGIRCEFENPFGGRRASSLHLIPDDFKDQAMLGGIMEGVEAPVGRQIKKRRLSESLKMVEIDRLGDGQRFLPA